VPILSSNLYLSDYFGKVNCERAWKWDTRQQPLEDYDLWYAWSGEGQMTIHQKSYAIGKGTCFLFRPGDRTIASHNPQLPLTVTFIHFVMPRDELQLISAPHRVVRDTFLFETYLNRYVEAMILQPPHFKAEAELLLTLMLMHLRREEAELTAAPADHLSSIIRTIAYRVRQNPSSPHSMEAMAEQAHLSTRYFALKFKQVMGCSVEQYLIRARIERAEHLLRYNGMNASEVAEALGYKDLSFFSRQFKQVRGKSPSQIKKEAAMGL
jgi:AraC family transcriptional regulator, arabinose operon regulatory protein